MNMGDERSSIALNLLSFKADQSYVPEFIQIAV
jgi:hypothetical protein